MQERGTETDTCNKDSKLSPPEQQAKVWETLKARNRIDETSSKTDDAGTGTPDFRQWPTYDAVISHMANADYNETLTCPFDLLPYDKNDNKTFCPHGVVCCAKVELFSFPESCRNQGHLPYTGLLEPSTNLNHCILRLSSAIKPPNLEVKSRVARAILYTTGEKLRNARLFPSAALKIFRDNAAGSGNLLFGGSKIGQRESNYFAHCQCTSMTERMPRPVKPFVRKFWTYSDYPLSLGISDFCKINQNGEAVENPESINFPFAVILRPVLQQEQDEGIESEDAADADAAVSDSFDSFVDHILRVPAGTALFDLFACPDPHAVTDPSRLERIGRITSTSEMIKSLPNDGIFFKHQKKEEDFALRPNWPDALNEQVTVDEGRVKGTIGKMAGWKVFEQHIEQGGFVDFEHDGDL